MLYSVLHDLKAYWKIISFWSRRRQKGVGILGNSNNINSQFPVTNQNFISVDCYIA